MVAMVVLVKVVFCNVILAGSCIYIIFFLIIPNGYCP